MKNNNYVYMYESIRVGVYRVVQCLYDTTELVIWG